MRIAVLFPASLRGRDGSPAYEAPHRLATPGFVSGAFAFGYGVARTVTELFREPDIQIGFLPGGLTMGMVLSIPMIIAGAAVMIWTARTHRPAAATRQA